MAYNRKDYYFRKAKNQGFAARSIFKLEEIDRRFKILRPGDQVLDLGAAPGSWSQYASQRVGDKGRVLGIDLQEISLTLPNAHFVQADLNDLNLEEEFQKSGFAPLFDLVMSDMAPRTTGIRVTDQARSFELCQLALSSAERFLKPGGHFICKFFHSEDFEKLRADIVQRFKRIEALRPHSTRKQSKEIFLVGLAKKKA